MIPGPEVRYRNLIKTIEQIVLPAVDPTNALAVEQAHLVVAHIRLMEGQASYIAAYDALCLRRIEVMGRDLAAAALGGAQVRDAKDRLEAVLDQLAGPDLAARRHAIAAAIDELVVASAVDGDPGFLNASQSIIIAQGRTQAWIDRSWFAAAGFDPEPDGLTPVTELFTGEHIHA